MKKIIPLTCLLLALLAAPAHATDVAALAAKMQKQYQSISSFSADFTQLLRNAASKEAETRTGKLVFAQPALIRWETLAPEKELLVVGKDAVWNAFPEEKAVYRYSVEEVLGSKTMLRFLSGKARLNEDFHIQEEQGNAPAGQVMLRLVPREAEPGMVLAYAWVDERTNMLARVSIEDFYGNVNDLTLSNVTLNAKVSPEQFQYSPPQGFSVFDNEAGQGKKHQ